jgi:membrane fusion protein (multidrug efflux system)
MDMRVAAIDSTAAPIGLPPEKTRRLSWKLAVATLIAAAAAATAWWLLRGPAITVARVTRGAAAEIVYATGSVEPETWSRSTPLVRGRIIERCRCEGKAVKRGDLLARLDDKEALATLNDLHALEDFQQREFDRQSQLLSRGVATSQAFQKAESDLARIKAQIAAQTQRLEYYKLVSPMDGTVLKEDGEVGDMVEPGTILYRIGLEKPLWVVADVNEEDIPRVKVGQYALLRTDAFTGQVLPGNVKQITPAGDPVSKTFRVRIGLPDDTPLRVGMSVEANIISREKLNAVLVPANAVVHNNLFAIEDGRARLRKVEIGIRGTGFVEILQGASEGESVASPATANIKNGSPVRATPAEASAP